MNRMKVFVAVLAALGFFTILATMIRQPKFLFGLNSTPKFTDVYTRAAVEPETVLFADQFQIKLAATFDAREFKENSVRFIAPKEGLVVKRQESSKSTEGSVVTLEKIITVQCLSCLPQDSPYDLGGYAVVMEHKNGKLETFFAGDPQLRVVSRLSSADPLFFPQTPIVNPMRPGMNLTPYFIFFAVVLSLLAFIFIAAACFLPQGKKIKAQQPIANTAFRQELVDISRLAEALAQNKISPDKIVLEAYRLFRTVLNIGPVAGAVALEQKFLPIVFGPPEQVKVQTAQELLSQLRRLIINATNSQERGHD